MERDRRNREIEKEGQCETMMGDVGGRKGEREGKCVCAKRKTGTQEEVKDD